MHLLLISFISVLILGASIFTKKVAFLHVHFATFVEALHSSIRILALNRIESGMSISIQLVALILDNIVDILIILTFILVEVLNLHFLF